MDSRRRLLVVFVVALAACAAARPDSGNDINAGAGKTTNEINSKEEKHTKPENAKAETPSVATNPGYASPTVSVAEPNADEDPKTDLKPSSDKDNADENIADGTKAEIKGDAVAKAVNEQYPSAVLFGGTCGGTIISPTWVLSAGHCTLFTGGRYVLAGTNNSEDGTGVERRVKRLVIHPLFSVGPYWLDADRFDIKQVAARWDFLLAELESPLPLDGKTMAAAVLNDESAIPEGLAVGYAGYGAEHHGDTMRHEMHAMELEVLPDSRCKESLVQFQSEEMICTKGRPPRFDSACNGDSGSGLVAGGKLYGVASWVENDAHSCFNGALVVFSRVSSVRDWIRQVSKI